MSYQFAFIEVTWEVEAAGCGDPALHQKTSVYIKKAVIPAKAGIHFMFFTFYFLVRKLTRPSNSRNNNNPASVVIGPPSK